MSFTGSSSNRAQLAYKLEGVYPNNFGVAQGGNGTLLNMTSETLDFNVKTVQSKAIRADRLPTDQVLVSSSAGGGFNAEHVYREYDPFVQGAMQQDFAPFGTNGVSAAIAALTCASLTLTAGVAPSGNDDFTTLKKGQWFTIIPAVGATQAVKDYLASRAFRLSSVTPSTGTILTLDATTPFDTAKGGVSLAGAKISSAYAWNGTTMKTYTLEVQHQDINVYRQFLGMAVSKFDLKLTVGDIVTMSFEFMGKSGDLGAASLMGSPAAAQTFTPANATRGIFDFFEGGASVSATTYIKSADISIDNTLRGQDAVGVFGVAGVGVGTHNAMGKMQVYFADAVMFNKFYKQTASSLAIPILDVAGNGYVYYFPRIKYSAAKVAVGGQDQDNMLDMDWSAFPETDATSPWFGKSAIIFRVGA